MDDWGVREEGREESEDVGRLGWGQTKLPAHKQQGRQRTNLRPLVNLVKPTKKRKSSVTDINSLLEFHIHLTIQIIIIVLLSLSIVNFPKETRSETRLNI